MPPLHPIFTLKQIFWDRVFDLNGLSTPTKNEEIQVCAFKLS